VVDTLADESLVLRYRQAKSDTVDKTRELFAVDLLVNGKVDPNADGCFAYRWTDVKKGDTARLFMLFDDGEQKWYCYRICIERRPGGKLPESQKPKEDGRYVRESLLNEIDNGEDVSEEAIIKVFPPRFERPGGQLLNPGGLPLEYRTKLTAIRDKKEADTKEKNPKAKPPEKK
jgi:hypothetical protein